MTLAQLKRDANSGNMALELIERFGKTGDEIKETMRGIRKVSRSNTVGIFLINNDGKESELTIRSAKLIEYDGKTLTIFEAGHREPTDEEKSILAKRDELYKKYEDTYNGGFWQVKQMIADSKCPWMDGGETKCGKRYSVSENVVYDNLIKGEAVLKYKVYFEKQQ